MPAHFSLIQYHYEARQNKYFRGFTVCCRIALALGFIPSGIVKIMGERFTGLPPAHPLGHYFDALQQTGFYYPFIGIVQIIAALLLLIPRTALLGALVYFPIMLNICVLAYATRFEGTRITTLMLLADLYLLAWDYQRLRGILPFRQGDAGVQPPVQTAGSQKFPLAFFGAVIAVAALVVLINAWLFAIRPGNSQEECRNGCAGNAYPVAARQFCDCIYKQGKPLDSCLKVYELVKQREKKRRLHDR